MKTKIKIRRRCGCGCGQITNPGRRWCAGHNARCFSEETKQKISTSEKGKVVSLETRRKQSLARIGVSPGNKGVPMSEESKLKMSLSSFRSHPNDEYCDEWRSREYKRDLRKDYCENAECERDYKQLNDHHINLNKKDCRPDNVMTLCTACHLGLHRLLKQVANKFNILTINRDDHIVYIHKRTGQVMIRIERKEP